MWIDVARPHIGRWVQLEPLSREHLDGLREAVSEPEPSPLWYLHSFDGESIVGRVESMIQAREAHTMVPYAQVLPDGRPVGLTSLYDFDEEVPRLKVGHTWLAPSQRGKGINTEAKLMLFRYAFDELGCEAVALRTQAPNIRAQQAILALGAKPEGVQRAAYRRSGVVLDGCRFSVLKSEWPATERILLEKLKATFG